MQNTTIMQTERNFEVQGLGRLPVNNLPMLKIAQDPKQLACGGLAIGDFFDQVTQQSYGRQVDLIAYFRYTRRTKFPERGNGTKVECFSPDTIHGSSGQYCAQCPKRRSSDNYNSRDLCTDQIIFVVALPDQPENMLRLPCMRSNYSAGKKIEKLLKVACTRQSIPVYAQVFSVFTEQVQHQATGGNSFTFDARLSNQISCETTLEKLRTNQLLIEKSLQLELAEFLERYHPANVSEKQGTGILTTAWQSVEAIAALNYTNNVKGVVNVNG